MHRLGYNSRSFLQFLNITSKMRRARISLVANREMHTNIYNIFNCNIYALKLSTAEELVREWREWGVLRGVQMRQIDMQGKSS